MRPRFIVQIELIYLQINSMRYDSKLLFCLIFDNRLPYE